MTKGTLTDGLMDAYADNLEDLTEAALTSVFEQAERTCKFLPVPAELRALAPRKPYFPWEDLARSLGFDSYAEMQAFEAARKSKAAQA